MSDSPAVRLHNGDKSLKKTKNGEVVSKARSAAAKKKNSPLAVWRKVSKEYLKKGGFVTIPKKGTKEYNALREIYDIALARL
jgi:hypothetical protein